ncbi:MAG: hypothetical protein M3O32_07130 [Actinomycetota bacterium]|nr:hypothetical protein [Actinomycetota bacterium]
MGSEKATGVEKGTGVEKSTGVEKGTGVDARAKPAAPKNDDGAGAKAASGGEAGAA